ncbi:hypothetical protein BKA58DRAFT_449814 [Alternaria rosae]|uniref:uncharacterized protein n=1 Tax=Alternaria rosae TaxID=1187941 RepID=UPI001E8DF8D8|nr:uncharacterized protein BKA58DRAFT_449814 [Alternaria rosae]KAH6857322.1 hypothetical protein BKA58DRAFT_449814 [Alternaria rosae]
MPLLCFRQALVDWVMRTTGHLTDYSHEDEVWKRSWWRGTNNGDSILVPSIMQHITNGPGAASTCISSEQEICSEFGRQDNTYTGFTADLQDYDGYKDCRQVYCQGCTSQNCEEDQSCPSTLRFWSSTSEDHEEMLSNPARGSERQHIRANLGTISRNRLVLPRITTQQRGMISSTSMFWLQKARRNTSCFGRQCNFGYDND